MKVTNNVQKFFSLGAIPKCPYPPLSAIETKKSMYHVFCNVSISWRILPDNLFQLLASLNHEKKMHSQMLFWRLEGIFRQGNQLLRGNGVVYLHPGHLRFWVRLGRKSSRISRILTPQLISTGLKSCFIVLNAIDLFKSCPTVILICHNPEKFVRSRTFPEVVQLCHITWLDLLWMRCCSFAEVKTGRTTCSNCHRKLIKMRWLQV